MNEYEYIAQPEVAGFIAWLQARLSGDAGFSHEYELTTNKSQKPRHWQCHSFYNAFEQYQRPFSYHVVYRDGRIIGRSYRDNEVALNTIRSQLRGAIRRRDNETCHQACQMIFAWSMGQKRNLFRIEGLYPRLADYLRQVQILFNTGPQLQTRYQVCVNGQMEPVQKTSGFSKIYSLACNNFIAYDSRVSAALALLVRCYLEGSYSEGGYSEGKEQVVDSLPESLGFHLCAGQGTVDQNPSRGNIVFTYTANPTLRIRSNLMANWIAKNLDLANAPGFADQRDPLRAFEAALYMIGHRV